MATDTSERLLDFIQAEIGSPVSRETPMDALGLDSLEMLDFQLECEKRFGKHIPDEMQGKLITVGDLADFFS